MQRILKLQVFRLRRTLPVAKENSCLLLFSFPYFFFFLNIFLLVHWFAFFSMATNGLLPGISFLLISTVSVHSPAFFSGNLSLLFPALVVTSTGSCVGPQNEIGHPAQRCRQSMQVPVWSECPRNIKLQKTCVIVFLGLYSETVDII